MDVRTEDGAAPLSAWARRHPVLVLALFSAAYALAAWAGRSTRLPGTPLALVWPAAAVAVVWLAVSWRRPRRRALDVAVLAAVTAAVNAATGATPVMAAVFAAANVVQALGTCWVVHRLQPQAWRLRAPSDLVVLVLGCVAGSVASAAIGPTGMSLTGGADLLPTAGAWVLRNASSTFVFGALALRLADGLAGEDVVRGRSPVRRRAELAATLALHAASYAVVFQSAPALPLAFVLLPLSLWFALRFSTTTAAAHVLLVGSYVVLATLTGRGPFLVESPATSVLLAQSYVSTSALVALSLALFRDDRQHLLAQVQEVGRAAAEHAALLGTVLQTVDVGVVACDADGRLTMFNAATREFHGMPEDPTLDPADWASHYDLYLEDAETLLPVDQVPLLRALRGERVADATLVIAPRGRPARTVRCDGQQLRSPDGRLLGAVVAMTDVTQSRRDRRELEEREQRFRAAFHDSPTPIAYLDLVGGVRDANAALRRLLAAPSTRLVGRPLEEHVHPEDRSVLDGALRGGGTGADGVEVRLLRADGSAVWCALTTIRTTDLAGQPYLLAQLHDVHARKTAELALEASAQRDPLTGLGNRTALHARLAALL
ncbi:MAG TPA: PAS domain S-box protein, partial [Mycobacteriales bacterium]|nr:PAS domain S-box protein [Mycobacteriales bacterium]